MKGMNATTGRRVTGLAHLYQSIAKIVTTPIASRLARRSFGAEVFDLLDAPNNGATRTQLYAAIATALMRWEIRLKLTRVSLSVDSMDGKSYVDVEGYTTETGARVEVRVPVNPQASQ